MECWGKLKELRVDHYREVSSAREQGKIMVTGSAGAPVSLIDGLGDDVVFFVAEPYAASVATNPALSLRYLTAVEERGYAVGRAKTPDELGWPMATRDDVLRAWGRRTLAHPMLQSLCDAKTNAEQLISLNKHWQSDGIVLHYNRGCPLAMNFRHEVKVRLDGDGIPVASYEANGGDIRDTDGAQITKQLTAFVDLLEQASSAKSSSAGNSGKVSR